MRAEGAARQNAFRLLARDERGQASVEYILMLTVSLMILTTVIKKFIQPYLAKISGRLVDRMQSTLFNKANLHHLKIGR